MHVVSHKPVEQPSAPPTHSTQMVPSLVSSTPSRAEYALIPLLESTLSTFLTLQELNIFCKLNKTWKKSIVVDIKKHPYINQKCSRLIACHVQNMFRHSEETPMTNGRLLEIAKIEQVFKLTIPACPYIRHLHMSIQDLIRITTLQDVINKIPMLCLLNEEELEVAEEFFTPLMGLSAFKQAVDDQAKDSGLAQLTHFTALRSLKISTLETAEFAHFAHVACLAGTLESLTIITRNVINDILQKTLTPFTALTNLNIDATGFTDVNLHALSSLTALRNLSFMWCPITGSDLNALSQLTGLQALSFDRCNNITTANVAQLAHLTALQSLSFINTIFITYFPHLSPPPFFRFFAFIFEEATFPSLSHVECRASFPVSVLAYAH